MPPNSRPLCLRGLFYGLSNRRVGATSINSESSCTHTVFTCVVESRCKVHVKYEARLEASPDDN